MKRAFGYIRRGAWYCLKTLVTTTIVLIGILANLVGIWSFAISTQEPEVNNIIEVLVEMPQQVLAFPEELGDLLEFLNQVDAEKVNQALDKYLSQ